jgi:hypothetical protein
MASFMIDFFSIKIFKLAHFITVAIFFRGRWDLRHWLTSIPFKGMVANVLMLTPWNILKEMNVYEYLTLQFKFALNKSCSSVFDTLLLSEIPRKFISLSTVKLQWRIQLGDWDTPTPKNLKLTVLFRSCLHYLHNIRKIAKT